MGNLIWVGMGQGFHLSPGVEMGVEICSGECFAAGTIQYSRHKASGDDF